MLKTLGKTVVSVFMLSAAASVIVLGAAVFYYFNYLDTSQKAQVYEPTFTASTWGFFDPATGAVFAGKDTEAERPIASLTKLFTAYAALKSDKLELPVTLDWSDISTYGRAGKLSYGDTYTLHQLLFPLLIESSNDAGTAIARTLGSEFPRTVGELKTELDLASTTIADGSGLSPENVSNVEDLARFYSYLEQNEQHIVDITRLPMYIGDKTGWVNTDPALSYQGYRGGKQGYLPEAGDTFVGTFDVDGREIGMVFLGSKDIATDLDAGLRYLEANS